MSEPDEFDAQLLRAFLRDRDVECPSCGYNIRDSDTGLCPECGEVAELRLTPAEPKIAWPIAGVIGLAAGAGFSLLMSVYFLIQFGLKHQGGGPDIWKNFWLLVVIPLVVQSFALLVWLRCWRAIRRLPLRTRVVAAVGVWTLPILNVGLFTAYIR